jgi:hypothetical protein
MLALAASGVMTITGMIGITNNYQKSQASPYMDQVIEMRIRESQLARVTSPVTKAPDILDELIGKKVPSFKYLLYVATCETEQNWQNSGVYAGGFGFMHRSNKVYKDYAAKQSTWLQWGGAEFAKIPQRATSKEQALVWIRTYATGWVRPNGVYKPPTNVPRSNCHDDMKIGWHKYRGQKWPVPDNWKLGDPQIKPWDK